MDEGFMKIDAINRIFSSLTEKPRIESEQEERKVQDPALKLVPDQQQAANIASDFGVEGGEDRSKVERIKEQVNSGTYNVDSREVATAMLKDLMSL